MKSKIFMSFDMSIFDMSIFEKASIVIINQTKLFLVKDHTNISMEIKMNIFQAYIKTYTQNCKDIWCCTPDELFCKYQNLLFTEELDVFMMFREKKHVITLSVVFVLVNSH